MAGLRFDDLVKQGGKLEGAAGGAPSAPRFEDLVKQGGQVGSESAPAPEQKGFQVPYPESPVEGLEYDAKTHKPLGSLTGPANPIRAASLGLQRGMLMEGNDELAAKVDSALGTDTEEGSLQKSRNAMALNQEVYPWVTGASKMAGTLANPVVRAGGAAFQTAKGIGGVALRALAAMGLGAAVGGTEGAMSSEGKLDDPETAARAKRGAVIGGVAGTAGQLAIGEPVRAIGGAVASRIASSDEGIARGANEAIASAQGRAGKQAQEAVGALENLHNARGIREGIPSAARAPAPVAPKRPMGIPPNAEWEDPLYVIQGMDRASAKALLIDKMRMVPEAADEFLAGEAAPYLKQAAAAAPPAVGPSTRVMQKYGPDAMNNLMDRRVGNADRAIGDLINNPVKIPGSDTAIRGARDAANVAAKQEAGRGARNVAIGAAAHAVGNPMGIGTYNVGRGIQRLVRAAFSAPAVLDRLRGIPNAGRAISAAAGKGSVALETTLFALSRDPQIAAELEKIDGENAPLELQQDSEEE